jgi:hypothetical protein
MSGGPGLEAVRQQAREVIMNLAPGTAVGHASPEMPGWEGVIEADGSGRWWLSRMDADVLVRWTAGTTPPARPGRNGSLGGRLAVGTALFMALDALTVKGTCPACSRPARYVFAANQWKLPAGWQHDDGTAACPAGS